MDIEQLKLILETLGAAGEGTKELALIYFGYLFAKAIGLGLLLAGLITCAYKLISRALGASTIETELAKLIDTYPPLSKGERERVFSLIRRAQESNSPRA